MMRVMEIFPSVSGEVGGIRQGDWTTFVRFTGCNLRCAWCDTARSWDSTVGTDRESFTIYRMVHELGLRNVILTGGEPMNQDFTDLESLCYMLKRGGHHVQIETNGTISPFRFDRKGTLVDSWVVDYKLPSSGMEPRMMSLAGFCNLPSGSWMKFVVCNPDDFDRALEVIKVVSDVNKGIQFAMSACDPTKPDDLVQKLKIRKLWNVHLNVQIHKVAELCE